MFVPFVARYTCWRSESYSLFQLQKGSGEWIASSPVRAAQERLWKCQSTLPHPTQSPDAGKHLWVNLLKKVGEWSRPAQTSLNIVCTAEGWVQGNPIWEMVMLG